MISQGNTVYLLTEKKTQYKVFKLDCDIDVKSTFIEVFNNPLKNGYNDCDEVIFKLDYQLGDDEIWKIDSFIVPKEIIESIDYADTVESYKPTDDTGITADGFRIRSIFMAEIINDKPMIKFQRFEKSQIVRKRRLALVFRDNVFVKNEDFCLNILESPDAIYYDGFFKFINYTNANKVLPLGDYYREATQKEIDNFKNFPIFEISNEDVFDKYSSAHNVRGQIAKILDSKTLEKYSAIELKNIAKDVNIELTVDGDKLVVPSEKGNIKELLTFLSEKIYKGPLSGKTFISSGSREKENK